MFLVAATIAGADHEAPPRATHTDREGEKYVEGVGSGCAIY